METFGSLDDFTHRTDAAVSLGMFDGVHRAHQKVLRILTGKAHELQCKSVVITFHPHPRTILTGEKFPLIVSQEEKRRLLEAQQTDIWCRLPFTPEFAALEPEELLELLDSRLHIRHIVLGYNHNFGKRKKGSIRTLAALQENYGFGLTEVPPLRSGNMEISSSAIREALRKGDIRTASLLLGYDYFALPAGMVRAGKECLRVTVAADKLLPAPGFYDGHWDGTPVRIQILDNEQMLVFSNGSFPEAEELLRHPLYWNSK